MPNSSHHDCQQTALTAAESYCKAEGLRFTPVRRRVLELIWDSHKPSKAYDILERLDKGADSKPPTVYRALDFLQANGFVHKLNSLNAYIGCHHPNHHEDCYFLICDHCQQVTECCDPLIRAQLQQTLDKQSFLSAQTTLEVQGLCQNCQNEKNQQAKA